MVRVNGTRLIRQSDKSVLPGGGKRRQVYIEKTVFVLLLFDEGEVKASRAG
jgi:hypothetical protein